MSQPPYPPPGYRPPEQYVGQPPPPLSPQLSAGAYVPPPLVFRGYRPTRGLAVAAVVAAALWALTDVVEGVTAWSAGDTYAQAARDRVPVENILTAYDVTASLWLLLVPVAYVSGCLLLWRLRKNAELLSCLPHTRSAGWVWAGWVVPFVLLWFPYQVVRDIKDATAPYARATVINWWWTLWLLSYATTSVASQLTPVSGMASESSAQALGAVETADAFLTVVGCTLWCLLLLRIVRDQDRAADATA